MIYGIAPSKSPAVESLGKISKSNINLRTLIWDNSPQRQSDFLPDGDRGETTWVHTPQNLGLAAIYNEVILNHLRSNEHLLLLDQDTRLPPNFFIASENAILRNPSVALFLPMVRAHERWVSPLYAAIGWGRYWKRPRYGLHKSRHVGAINSGMVISAEYLRGSFSGYDRDLLFYGTDTYFMLQFRRQKRWFYILDAAIDHDLSFFSTSTAKKIEKFREMRRGNAICYRQARWPVRALVRSLMTCAAIVYSIRYKTFDFLLPP